MLLVFLLVVSCQHILGGLVGSKLHYDLDRAEEYFEQFIITHDKEYFGDEHKQQNFEVFKQNLILINEKNAQDSHAVFAINQFTDVSTEEFLSKHTGLVLNAIGDKSCEMLTDSDVTTHDAPEEYDWRSQNAVTAVKNQKQCGACFAFGVTGNVEGQYAIKNKKQESFSEQQIVDCDLTSNGCSLGGDPLNAMAYLVKVGGQETEADYPYIDDDGTCYFDPAKIAVKVTGCKAYNLTDEEKSKEILFKTGPMTIGVDARDVQHYHHGIISNCSCTSLNHAVLLVGYGTEDNVPYWIIKNSWGPRRGEKGFFRVKRGVNSCGYLNYPHVTSVLG